MTSHASSTPTGGLGVAVVLAALWVSVGVVAARRRRSTGPDAEGGLHGRAALDQHVEAEARRGLRELEDWLGASRRTSP